MRFHSVSLKYEEKGKQIFDIHNSSCKTCKTNIEHLKTFDSKQLIPKFINAKFETCVSEYQGRKQWMLSGVSTPQPLMVGIVRDDAGAARRDKLVKVLEELKISELKIDDEIRHELIQIIDKCLDAFAADDDSSIVVTRFCIISGYLCYL